MQISKMPVPGRKINGWAVGRFLKIIVKRLCIDNVCNAFCLCASISFNPSDNILLQIQYVFRMFFSNSYPNQTKNILYSNQNVGHVASKDFVLHLVMFCFNESFLRKKHVCGSLWEFLGLEKCVASNCVYILIKHS